MSMVYAANRSRIFGGLLLAAAILICLSFDAPAQTDLMTAKNASPAKTDGQAAAALMPVITELRGVSVGMTADEVLDELGKPKLSDPSGLFYQFSKQESLQIQLDADKKVKIAAMIYLGQKADAHGISEVFGPDVSSTSASDGRIYKLVRYPDAGFWVSYSKLVLDDGPMVTVTLQKM